MTTRIYNRFNGGRMKKSLVFLLGVVFLMVASFASCQTRHDSPQNVLWDAPIIYTGMQLVSTEISVIPLGEDKLISANYSVLGSVLFGEPEDFYIDLEANSLVGRYVVAIRFYLNTVGMDPYFDDYGYSDDPENVLSIDGTPELFTIEYVPRIVPTMLRVQ